MSEPMHAARRRRERGAAAVLTISSPRTNAQDARRRAMAAHPVGSARMAAVLALPARPTTTAT